MFYRETGAGPAVVCIHSNASSSGQWRGLMELLAPKFRVLAPDSYGAGKSPPYRGASLRDEVALIEPLLKNAAALVGHSYGGVVITEAAKGNPNVQALVYVAGFVPDAGESALTLSAKFPGSTLGDALAPVKLRDGGTDLYIQPAKFHAQFAADVPDAKAALMAATQRPVTQAALAEAVDFAAWKRLPSYVIYGEEDRNIPAAVMKFMAERARSRKAVAVKKASHALMVSHPAEVAALIEDAANSN